MHNTERSPPRFHAAYAIVFKADLYENTTE